MPEIALFGFLTLADDKTLYKPIFEENGACALVLVLEI
jgi:hypothetical protein